MLVRVCGLAVGVSELLHVVVLNAALGVVALGAGTRLLDLVDRALPAAGMSTGGEKEPLLARLGAALLLGFGALAYVGVLLGLLHAFHTVTVACALLAIAVITRSDLLSWAALARKAPPLEFPRARDAVTVAAVATSAVLVIIAFFVAVAPPTANDALSYHLPQAHELANGHVLWLNLGGHPFYGSIPKLIETLFAEAIVLHGDAFAQVVHLSIAVAFLLFAAGTVERFFGRRAAALAVLGMLCYREFTANATSAMIDAGVVSFEVAGVLAAASWAQSGRAADAARAAVLIGLAAAAKYSALVTLALFGVLAVVIAARSEWSVRQARKALFGIAALAFAASGFWYVKNLVKYGNPTYPLYFGHRGVAPTQYEGIISDIQQFGPRTLTDFASVPQRFSSLTNLVAYASFFLGPLAVLVRRANAFTAVALLYAGIYLPYWFFLATHQLRFLMPAVLVLIVLAATTLDRALQRLSRRRIALAVPIGAAIAVPVAAAGEPIATAVKNVTQIEHAKYGVGLQSRDEYLGDTLGCQYRVLRWLDTKAVSGNVLDDWSQWHDRNVDYYADDHHFVPGSRASPAGRFAQELAGDHVRFYYFKDSVRAAWRSETDPTERAWYSERRPLDDWADAHSKLVYRMGECHLKRITSAREGAASGQLP